VRSDGFGKDALDREKTFESTLAFSDSEEVGNSHQHDPDGDQQDGVGHKIGEEHEGHPADEWDDRSLLLSIDEEAKPDGTEKQTPKK
jgi:hypothetical protein